MLQFMNKILVFQTWGIGDMIMATPMLWSLRQQLPKAYITVIAGSRASADVVDGSPICNEVRIISPAKMSFYQLIRTFSGFRRECFNAAIICTRISPRIAQLLKLLSGIKVIAGDSLSPRRWGYTHWCPVEPDLHRVTSNLNILRMIVPEAQDGSLYVHLDAKSHIHANQFWAESCLNGKNVLGIHPGGGFQQKNKIFPAEKFRTVIRLFLERLPDTRVIIFFGPEDRDIIPLLSGIDERVISITNFSLRVVGAIISKVRVLLSNDSGLGHIAAALRIPVVTLAGPTNISSTRPWGNDNAIVRTRENLECIPCYGTNQFDRCKHIKCLKSISEEYVVEKLNQYFMSVK